MIHKLRDQLTAIFAIVGYTETVKLELQQGDDLDMLYIQPFDLDQLVIIEEHHDNRGLFEVSSETIVGRRECEPGVTIPVWGKRVIHASLDENSGPAAIIAGDVVRLLSGETPRIHLRDYNK